MKIALPFLVLLLIFFPHVVTCGESTSVDPAIQAADTLMKQGAYRESTELLRQILREQGIAQDGLEAATVYDYLGRSLNLQGQGAEACLVLKQMLEIRTRLCQPDSIMLAGSRSTFAHVLNSQGRNSEALQLNEEALRALWTRKDKEGTEVSEVITSIILNLADAYAGTGKYWKAEKMYSQSLDRTTKEGERSRDQKLIILGNLASLYTKMEKYPKALKLSMALADSYIALNGDEHPGLATILNTQAIAIHKLGRLEEAEKIFIRAGKIAENTLSENHRTTALIRTGLAMVYLDQGRYAESDKLLQKALATFLKAFGKEHLSIGAVCSRIGDWHHVQNLHADAISYYQRALDIISKKVPDNALELENVTSHYALSLRALGRDQEALKLEEEAKKIRERRAAAMQINPQDQDIFLTP